MVKNNILLDKLQLKFVKLPDIERLLSKVYTYSTKQTVKAVYIDVGVINRLHEFYKLLNHLKKLKSTITEVFCDSMEKKIQSKRLRSLLTFKKMSLHNSNQL